MRLPAFNAYRPVSLLKHPAHVPARARFPVIDAHNHLYADVDPDEMLRVMDSVGVRLFVNVTGNCSLPFDGGGYRIIRREHAVYHRGWEAAKPGRFASFTMADFARWDDFTLDLERGFAERCTEALERDMRSGAVGLKVTKELGLRFREPDGSMIRVDDERLYPVWRWAGSHDIPVLIHTSDPWGFFLPVDGTNEHYATMLEYPGWSCHGSFFSKAELLEQRTRMMADHPDTTFICPHVANNPEDLEWVAAPPPAAAERLHRSFRAHGRTGKAAALRTGLHRRLPGPDPLRDRHAALRGNVPVPLPIPRDRG